MMIHAMVRMDLNPSRYAEALDILHSVACRVRVKPGCMGCHVYRDTEEKRAVVVFECWSDEERMQQHLRSRDYQSVLLVMEMARNVPEISFYTIEHITGVETIEMVRLGHQAVSEEGPGAMSGRADDEKTKNHKPK